MTCDCIYCRAGSELETLSGLVKEAFVNVVRSDVLESFAEVNGVEHCAEEVSKKEH